MTAPDTSLLHSPALLSMATGERKMWSMHDFRLKCMDDGSPAHTATITFATIGELDSDGDMFMPGSLAGKECFFGQWGHSIWSQRMPIGKCLTREESGLAVADVTFIKLLPIADETWAIMDEMPELVEFSVGMFVTKYLFANNNWDREIHECELLEISPVIKGAQPNTGVLATKGEESWLTTKSAKEALAGPTDSQRLAIIKARQFGREAKQWA